MTSLSDIDIQENTLRRSGDLLDILLIDRTSDKNILWATDSYQQYGREFEPKKRLKPELVSGAYGKLIQPRAAKLREEQKRRTKEKAEVFTPLKIVDQMNKAVDWASMTFPAGDETWQDYVRELRLEIACGEAPFIVSRYNPTSHTGKLIKLQNRVGFLDRKLRAVSQYCDKPKNWTFWAKEAYKASYGYEWQGDNLLIARENLLYTLIDYYKDKFNRRPSLAIQTEFAEIISWNIFQMDGVKFVTPMSCKHKVESVPGLPLFDEPPIVTKYECEGCSYNRPAKHNGRYVKIMDWEENKKIKFINLLGA